MSRKTIWDETKCETCFAEKMAFEAKSIELYQRNLELNESLNLQKIKNNKLYHELAASRNEAMELKKQLNEAFVESRAENDKFRNEVQANKSEIVELRKLLLESTREIAWLVKINE